MTDFIRTIMEEQKPVLIYITDPMCSWCWAFSPIYDQIQQTFLSMAEEGACQSVILAGGLAPDSDQPMPEEQQDYIQSIWHNIERKTGTAFNYDFWEKCQPRRSTYPACRALLAARKQGLAYEMLSAIQQAYYMNAENPSDLPVLEESAGKVPALNLERFKADMAEVKAQGELEDEVNFVRQLGVQGFPSLVLKKEGNWYAIPVDYNDPQASLAAIQNVF